VSRGRRAVFLDRDGTLIVEKDYLADPDDVELVEGAVEALRRLRKAGFLLVVVTNQSGIARGLYTEADYHAVAERVDQELARRGVELDAVRFCPHHPDHTGPCDCRKPATGMYRDAAAELGVDPARSWFVGDKPSDVLPARELGGQGILVRTGYGEALEKEVADDVAVVDDLGAAAALILAGKDGLPGRDDARQGPQEPGVTGR
jgi:D-glycero-D-manno-heptose 1,7-bisphosphate phosphatase